MQVVDTSLSREATEQATGQAPGADIEMPVAQAPADEGLPKELTTAEAQAFGWEEPSQNPNSLEEKLLDPAQAETISEQPSETEEATAASPGSGQETSGNAPAPQLDSNQQFQLMLYQQMQAQQQQQMEFQRQLVESLRPPKAPEPEIDPMADLPEKFRNIEGLSDALKYVHNKNQSALSQFEKKLEGRIAAAAEQRKADRYANEAVGLGTKILQKGFVFDQPNESAVITDALRDMSLALADVRGGTPAEYEQALNRVIDTAVRGKINYLNQQAKAKVAQKHQPKSPQIVATSSIPSTAQSEEPGIAEVRAAGYRDMGDARWDDFSKVHAKRARARG